MANIVMTKIIDAGAIGENAVFSLNENGVLTITGEGEICEFSYENKDMVKAIVIKDGITSIGKNMFTDYAHLTKVILPETLQEIQENAFLKCYNLQIVEMSNNTNVHSTAFLLTIYKHNAVFDNWIGIKNDL